ncbi:MAG: serine/threonine protein kinase, partial [Planctomycetes bacterium]|nr:serine/threonine protein kinase [Planctomycetota bacterium]
MPNWEQLLGQIDDAPPPDVPGYRVERLISERGQGAVFLARAADGRRVAIKRWKLPTSRAAREVRALQRLDHPGVVRVLEGAVDRGSGLPCVVMDYVDAPTLLAAGRRLPAERAAAILAQVARALAYVHGAGLVHRDVKPGNVLVRPDGAAVLVDFGVVKEQAEPSLPEVTATGGRALGTRPYMAPEQLGLVEAPVGPRADVYALGVTLYQCLTGALPFDSDAAFERRERDPWRA